MSQPTFTYSTVTTCPIYCFFFPFSSSAKSFLFLLVLSFVFMYVHCPVPTVGKNCAYKISKPSYFMDDLAQLLSLNSRGQGAARATGFTTIPCSHLQLYFTHITLNRRAALSSNFELMVPPQNNNLVKLVP